MTGFFIKKAFFDSWDNLISLVVLNLGYLLILLLAYGGLELLSISSAAGMVALLVVSACNSLYIGAVSSQTKHYAMYERPGFSAFKSAFAKIYRHALLHWIVNTLLLTVFFFVLPFYLSYGSLFAFAIAVIVFWVALAFMLALMYYYPLALHMPNDKPTKTLKKSLMVLGDNLLFSLFLGIYSVINLALTIVFATIIPGISGIELSRQVAVKLLLFKYDYIEDNPQANRKQIPWEELLFDERDKVGVRTLRGMIFPWKE